MNSFLKTTNIALRGLMEFCIVGGLAYWGYYFGTSTLTKVILAIGAPLIIFGFWGMVDFRNIGKYAELYRLTQELILSFLAAFAMYSTGLHFLGLLLAVLSIVHHVMVYLLGERLLKV